jgi:hypothetical protein
MQQLKSARERINAVDTKEDEPKMIQLTTNKIPKGSISLETMFDQDYGDKLTS